MARRVENLISKNPGVALMVANLGIVTCFFLLVGVYKEAKTEGMLEFMDFLKSIVKPF